jgi:hypothetical protein
MAQDEVQGKADGDDDDPGKSETVSETVNVSIQPRTDEGEADLSLERPALATLSTGELIKRITSQVGALAAKQIDLAKTELQADLRAEIATVGKLGLAAVAGLATINLLLVTAVLAMAQKIPPWSAGLIMSGITLGIAVCAAVVGWKKRIRAPLARTRRSLKKDASWTKERAA